MMDMILTNIKINLKFYRRNRLLIVASIIIVSMMALSALPTLFFMTKTKHLMIIQGLFSQMSGLSAVITAALGLLFISYHLRNHTTKMVFTKPCSPGTWYASSLLSALLVAMVLYVFIFTVCSALFFVWDLPYQWGLVVMTFNDILQTIIILSYLSFLAVLFHPVIAVLIFFLFQERTFYYLKILLMGGIKSVEEGALAFFLKVLKLLVDVLYMIVPTSKPFSDKLAPVYSTFRIKPDTWKYLFLAFDYCVMITVFLFILSVYFLRRKRHI